MASCLLFVVQLGIVISRRVSIETLDESIMDASENYTDPSLSMFPSHGRPVLDEPFRVMQYNILAKKLGNNRDPWFLFGGDVTQEQRADVKARHVMKEDGEFVHVGFENKGKGYAEQILSPKQRREIVQRSEEVFAWEGKGDRLGRGVRLAKEIANALSHIIILEEVDALLDVDEKERKVDGLFTMINNHAAAKVRLHPDAANVSQVLDSIRLREARLRGPVYSAYLALRERGRNPDGAAILWRNDRFQLIARDRVAYSGGDRIFCMALLEDMLTGKRVLIIATHLERNPEARRKEAVREEQILELVSALRSVAAYRYDAVVLAGDMNSDKLQDGWRSAVELFSGYTDVPPFADAFPDEPSDDAKACTSVTEDREVWIDYIFYSPHALRVVGKRGPERCPENPIPDEKHPSDHIPLFASFAWIAPSESSAWGVFKQPMAAKHPAITNRSERLIQAHVRQELAPNGRKIPEFRRYHGPQTQLHRYLDSVPE